MAAVMSQQEQRHSGDCRRTDAGLGACDPARQPENNGNQQDTANDMHVTISTVR